MKINKNQLIYFIILIFALLTIMFFNKNNARPDYGSLYNIDFVNSLKNGSFSLLEKPSEKLLALDNPYDPIQRNQEGLVRGKDYIWDAALFGGKYYVYYGILPAILLYLPYNLITGKYLSIAFGVNIFSMLSIFMLSFILNFFYKKYFEEKVPFRLFIFAQICLLFGTGIIWINVAPRFYELVSISGLFFSLLGMYLIWTSDKTYLLEDKSKIKISVRRLNLGALMLALAVACRPTYLLTSLLIIPWGIHKIKEIRQKNSDYKNDIITAIIVMTIPYIIVGILLMIYNNVRFGNPLDFGSKYQLTMNDMMNSNNGSKTLFQGLMCNLFNLPVFMAQFPFIQSNANVFETPIYYYIEDMPAGCFLLAPISFFVFSIFRILKNIGSKKASAKTTSSVKKEKQEIKEASNVVKDKNSVKANYQIDKELLIIITSLIFIGFFVAMIVTAFGGSTGRYLLDFSWMFALAGILIVFSNFDNFTSEEAKKIYFNIVLFITIYTLVFNLLTGFLYINGQSMKELSPEKFEFFENLICFWK